MVKEDAIDILKTVYGFEGGILKQMNGYDDFNYHYIKPNYSRNPHIKSISLHGYILKVINSKDSHNVHIQQAQNDFMIFLRKHNIRCSLPVKNKFGEYFSVEKLPLGRNGPEQRKHVVKLLEFQPGTLLKHVEPNFSLYYEVGAVAANLNMTAKLFQHYGYDAHESIWHLKMMPKVKSYTRVISNEPLKAIVDKVMEEFIMEVEPRMDPSDKQVIHGDLNSQNIVCQKENNEWKVSAIIDFGDSHISYPLYELAICMFYTILDCKEKGLDYLIGSGHTLAGYIRTNKVLEIDYLALKRCIAARLCQSYVLGLYNSVLQPENNYIRESLEVYPQILSDIVQISVSDLKGVWGKVIQSYSNKS
ncbi:UNVERIFIED_CONTAM: hypothetical protein PYX00_000066 [Menopon gallinae]|uniref:Hydroxylysine kinase n=1 Tax=Menopon gallinae TaxID=328185 RepID=A0AAW2I727_9NEOP